MQLLLFKVLTSQNDLPVVNGEACHWAKWDFTLLAKNSCGLFNATFLTNSAAPLWKFPISC